MSTHVGGQVSSLAVKAGQTYARRFPLNATEIAAAILVLLMLFVAIFFYFSFLRPEQTRLAELNERLELQQKVMMEIERGDSSNTSGANSVQSAIASLEAFKADYLKSRSQGQRVLIDDINALVKKHNTRLTSGLEVRTESSADLADIKKKKSQGADSVSVFPMLSMSFTVSGQYQDLRAFIGALEKNKQFLVISSVQLMAIEEGLVESEAGRRGPGRSDSGGLALTIGLSAYFHP